MSSTYYTYTTAHGPVTIRATGKGVAELHFAAVALDGQMKPSTITNLAATQIQEYLAGKRRAFDVPLDVRGSAFQKAVWEQVCQIPYGETRTSAQIADEMGKPGAHRSVGAAAKKNPVPIIIPTHRIEAANATGSQARIAQGLMALERQTAGQ